MGMFKGLSRDALHRELAPLLSADIDPSAIVFYGLPAYKAYQFRKDGELLKRFRKLLAKPKRRRLIQSEEYIRLGTFREMETYRFLEELWTAKLDCRQTGLYADFRRRLEAGESVHLRSKRVLMKGVEDLDDYFADYAKLLSSMSERGYLATGAKDRIMIMIDRDGGIMKETKGRHRLAAAQIVGAPSVPVRISHIHAAWVAEQAAAGLDRKEMARRAVQRTLDAIAASGAAKR